MLPLNNVVELDIVLRLRAESPKLGLFSEFTDIHSYSLNYTAEYRVIGFLRCCRE